MPVDHLFDELNVPPNLLLRFFLEFAAFEHALKNAGYLRDNRRRAEPDWWGYAEEASDVLDLARTQEVQAASNYLLNNPPRREIQNDGGLDWTNEELQDDLSDEEELIRRVKRVRNNLFHGGKFPDGNFDDPDRNLNLINYSLVVLEELKQRDPSIARHLP